MKQWFSSHFQRLFIIFKLLFYSSYTYSSDSSVSYCIHFYLLLYVMRFCRCRWGFISEVLQNVAGSWWLWIIPDDVGVIQNKHTSFDTRGRNLCVCAEPRWRKELKCQSLKTKPREVRALNLLRTFVERERVNSDEEEIISTQSTFYPVGLLRRMEMSGILSSSSSSSRRLATFLWHSARRRSFSTFHRFALIADEWGRESATHRVKQ